MSKTPDRYGKNGGWLLYLQGLEEQQSISSFSWVPQNKALMLPNLELDILTQGSIPSNFPLLAKSKENKYHMLFSLEESLCSGILEGIGGGANATGHQGASKLLHSHSQVCSSHLHSALGVALLFLCFFKGVGVQPLKGLLRAREAVLSLTGSQKVI